MKAMVSATPRAASSAAVKEAATVSSFVSLVIETAKNKEVAGSEGREEELDPTAKGGDSCEVSGDFTVGYFRDGVHAWHIAMHISC
jgi:hypothetical protein